MSNWTVKQVDPQHVTLLSCVRPAVEAEKDGNLYNDMSNPDKLRLHFGIGLVSPILEVQNPETGNTFNVAMTPWPTFTDEANGALYDAIEHLQVDSSIELPGTFSTEYVACVVNSGARLTLSEYADVPGAIELLSKEFELLDFEAFQKETMMLRSNFNPEIVWPLVRWPSNTPPALGATGIFQFTTS